MPARTRLPSRLRLGGTDVDEHLKQAQPEVADEAHDLLLGGQKVGNREPLDILGDERAVSRCQTRADRLELGREHGVSLP